MRSTEEATTGWEFVVNREGAAAIFDALVDLDTDEECTQSELAERADIPLKTLYVNDWLDEMVELGVLDDAGDNDDGEACYRLAEGSQLLAAARSFNEAFDAASPE